ncbi:MAG: prepilin peptidase [Acidiphilium sp.]|nr:prepilin peptidase [Acidiphilium sp.]
MTASDPFSLAWAGVILLCLIYAAFCDIAVRLIPNRVSAAIAGLAVPLRLADHQLVPGLLVAGLIFAVLTLFWMMRLLGGGDVKLWTACTLLVSPNGLDQGGFAIRVMLVGGLLAVAYLILRSIVRLRGRRAVSLQQDPPPRRSLIARIWRAEQWRARHNGSIPYGVAIAASAIITLWPQVPR